MLRLSNMDQFLKGSAFLSGSRVGEAALVRYFSHALLRTRTTKTTHTEMENSKGHLYATSYTQFENLDWKMKLFSFKG